MLNKVQKIKPKRSCLRKSKDYRSFKVDLRDDFNKKCGYCDDIDLMQGKKNFYHIEHFRPHSIKKFEKLKHEYSNLVYSCPFCNGAKSNTWKDLNGFIDPCEDEYDNHLYRNTKGQIISKTKQGEYIHINLKLYLQRHEYLCNIEKLQEQSIQIDKELTLLGQGHELEIIILREFIEIQREINKYTNLFHKEI
jgi:uncharacterized protein (TIGR02646 family)